MEEDKRGEGERRWEAVLAKASEHTFFAPTHLVFECVIGSLLTRWEATKRHSVCVCVCVCVTVQDGALATITITADTAFRRRTKKTKTKKKNKNIRWVESWNGHKGTVRL